ncbi:PucR family transcriptional regulator ligand-binding domain-containing protein [Metapseudomonas furukawaii]|jgi:hypothetical protein|uniref:Regulator of polyketide synthase expression n=1 Tax=Metapseudomonas furukawaii TaxID=1149133 RepID=A0AAD1FDK6_METFU|nr:Regulator of polyketide synthase expression [Pseudomonas furukawaii]BAU71803.1 regulator of polyketide synthase expression [Pseudomonas furukawaii]
MPLNLRDLLGLPERRSRLLSGAAGLDRPVRWAHVCELPDPTEWLGEGDLLMTTGLGTPATAEEQRRYLHRLAFRWTRSSSVAGSPHGGQCAFRQSEAPDKADGLRGSR